MNQKLNEENFIFYIKNFLPYDYPDSANYHLYSDFCDYAQKEEKPKFLEFALELSKLVSLNDIEIYDTDIDTELIYKSVVEKFELKFKKNESN